MRQKRKAGNRCSWIKLRVPGATLDAGDQPFKNGAEAAYIGAS